MDLCQKPRKSAIRKVIEVETLSLLFMPPVKGGGMEIIMKKISNLLWGIILVAVGVILALNALGIANIDIFFDGWWTLFIIVPCTIGLFTDYDKTGNLVGLCIGLFLLLRCQGILSFGLFWKLLVPAIIVFIGIKLIFGSMFGDRGEQVFKQIQESRGSVRNGAVTFSSATFDYTGEVFKGAQLDAVFGGIKCDLRDAIINGDCVINASAIFGGIDIYVPTGLNVKVNSNSIFGGVSGKERRNVPANQYTLYLNVTCLFGGVEIK